MHKLSCCEAVSRDKLFRFEALLTRIDEAEQGERESRGLAIQPKYLPVNDFEIRFIP